MRYRYVIYISFHYIKINQALDACPTLKTFKLKILPLVEYLHHDNASVKNRFSDVRCWLILPVKGR